MICIILDKVGDKYTLEVLDTRKKPSTRVTSPTTIRDTLDAIIEAVQDWQEADKKEE